MKDAHLLQPLQEYIKPSHSILPALAAGPVLLAVAALVSGERIPPFMIIFVLVAAVLAIAGHFYQRSTGDSTVLRAAERHGAKELAEDFRTAGIYAGDQLRVGRIMLYSQFSHDLWALSDLKLVELSQTTDSDGDKCFELWIVMQSGAVRISYSSNARDLPQLQSVCSLINRRIAEAREGRQQASALPVSPARRSFPGATNNQ